MLTNTVFTRRFCSTMRLSLKRIIVIATVILSAVACDQTTKHIARVSLTDAGSIRVLGNFFILTYAENQGAFLSLGSNWPLIVKQIVFLFLSSLVVIGASIYLLKDKKMGLFHTGILSLIIGGGIGNLIDRFFRSGYVTDFMNMGIGRVRTGIFNFADIFLLTGAALFVVTQLKREKKAET